MQTVYWETRIKSPQNHSRIRIKCNDYFSRGTRKNCSTFQYLVTNMSYTIEKKFEESSIPIHKYRGSPKNAI